MSKVHVASDISIVLCTTPVVRGGVRVPEGPTKVSWVLKLPYTRNKPSCG